MTETIRIEAVPEYVDPGAKSAAYSGRG